MNRLEGIITQIQKVESIMLIDVDVDGHGFSALLIESTIHPKWLQIGNSVDVVFKETEVTLAKNISGQISLRNRMKCNVLSVKRGELLSTILLQFQHYTITSAITTRSVDYLQITVGDELVALVKANEISLMKIR
ncbi:MAG: TOBE domain-containing protein [Bacteroidetes bacterium]|nr:TOBE domain-containing protein [Bacteroidota bacterium]